MKLNKIKIEEFVKEIEDFLRKYELLDGVCIYFNNKRHVWNYSLKSDRYEMREQKDICPLDYFEWAAPKHILSMSFEGNFYDVMNGYTTYHYNLQDKFLKLLERYGLYYELGNAWNLSCYPTNCDMEIEFTDYTNEIKPEPTVIYDHSTVKEIPVELFLIKNMWKELSSTTRHLGGSCTIGDGFEFSYKGTEYFMTSPLYQGSCIYEHWIETIKANLKEIGAESIIYNYGRLD